VVGRKKKKPTPEEKPASPPRPAESENITLTMRQVYELSYAAMQARGFPDQGNRHNVERICWLEQRGLPGFISLIAELTKEGRGVWTSRGPKPNAERQTVFDCPFITGVMLPGMADQLVVEDPEEIKGLTGPSSPVLLLPRIAEHAQKIGEPIEMFFKVGQNPPSFGARIVTDGDKILAGGDADAIMYGWGVSFSRFGKSMPKEAHGAIKDETVINVAWLEKLADFIARDKTDDRPTV